MDPAGRPAGPREEEEAEGEEDDHICRLLYKTTASIGREQQQWPAGRNQNNYYGPVWGPRLDH